MRSQPGKMHEIFSTSHLIPHQLYDEVINLPDVPMPTSCNCRLDEAAESMNFTDTKVVLLKLHIAEAPHEDLLQSMHALAMALHSAARKAFLALL